MCIPLCGEFITVTGILSATFSYTITISNYMVECMKQTKKRTDIVEAAGLPKDCIFGSVIVTVTGQNEAYVENYKGIIEYTSEKIKLLAKDCHVTFTGFRLTITYYTNDEMKISGYITGVSYQK